MTAAKLLVTSAWHLGDDGAVDERAVTVTIPLRTVSESNARERWQARHRRRKAQRTATAWAVAAAIRAEGITPPCAVTLTRIAPSSGLDDDNLLGSLKAVRDGVADALGVDDRDARVTWAYAQHRGGRREYAVRVTVRQVRGRP